MCGCVGVRVGEVGAEAGDPLKFGVSLELFQRLTIFKPRIILLVSWKKNSRQAGDLTETSVDLLAPRLPGSAPGARVPTCSSQLSTCVVAGCGCRGHCDTALWLILTCGLHTRSCALRFEENIARTMLFCVLPEAWGARQRAGCKN